MTRRSFFMACARTTARFAAALMAGRDAVLPDDIKSVAHDALRHRIIPSYLADAEAVTTEHMIDQVLGVVKVP